MPLARQTPKRSPRNPRFARDLTPKWAKTGRILASLRKIALAFSWETVNVRATNLGKGSILMTFLRVMAATSAVALVLGACAPVDQRTENPNQRTQAGAVTGAVVGGVLGALTGGDAGERQRGALAGAVIGGAVGAGIGYSLDQQARELQNELGNDRIQIINEGNQLVVRMPDDILFAVDSAAVNPALNADLRALAANLNRYPESTIQVIGHTDNTGTSSYNQGLSERRANAVSSILIGAGVSAGRVRSFGQGENQPLASNLTPEGRAQNRRVDITIIPNQAG